MATGTYRWKLTQAGDSTVLELVHVSGTDVIDVASKPITYKPTDAWSCRCESKMYLATAENVSEPDELNCNVCLVPVQATCSCCFSVTIADSSSIPTTLTGSRTFKAVPNQDGTGVCVFLVDNSSGETVYWQLSWDSETSLITLTAATLGITYTAEVASP